MRGTSYRNRLVWRTSIKLADLAKKFKNLINYKTSDTSLTVVPL